MTKIDNKVSDNLIKLIPQLNNSINSLEILNPECEILSKSSCYYPLPELMKYPIGEFKNNFDLIIGCIPSTNTEQFNAALGKCLKYIKPGGYVCNFQKLTMLEGTTRYNNIYKPYKPEHIYVYTNRVRLVDEYRNTKTGSATYCWVVWHKDLNGEFSSSTIIDWIKE